MKKLRKLTGAEQIAEELVAADIDAVFGVPAGHNLPLFAAAENAGIRTYGARHEQGAGFMAEAWSRVRRRPAVVVATAGPGLTNTLTPLAQAWADESRICVLALDNYLSTLGAPDGQFHGMPDMRNIVSSFATFMGCSRTPDEAAELVRASLADAAIQPARPTVVQLPSDVLTTAGGGPQAATTSRNAEAPGPDPTQIDRVAAALSSAARPVIYAGAGAVRSGAAPELASLAERLGCPVVTTVTARGAIPDDHPNAIGPIWDRFGPCDDIAARADVVLCVGTRLAPLTTRNGLLPLHGRTIVLDLDPETATHRYPSQLSVAGDVSVTLFQILASHKFIPDSNRVAGWLSEVQTAATQWRQTFAAGAPLAHELLSSLSNTSPANTIFVCDMTVLGYWGQRFLEIRRPGGLLSPYYFGALGYGLPAALGAKIADPDATVIAVCGDGGFLLNSQEMSTAAHLGLTIHAVVVNDCGYGSVRADEQRTGTGVLNITQVTNPRFDLLAAAHGWQYQAVSAHGTTLAKAIDSIRGAVVPTLTEVQLDAPLPMPYEVDWAKKP